MSDSSLPASFFIVGDAFLDLFCFGEWPDKGGDSQLTQPIQTMAGGSSTNTTTHLKALTKYFTNGKVTLCQQTVLNPDDHYGKILLQHAQEHDYPLINCKPENDPSATGHCVAIVAGEERSFMTYRGCVDTFQASHLDTEQIINTESHVHLHLAGYFNLSGFQEGRAYEVFTFIKNQRKEKYPHLATIISLVPQHDATRKWDGRIDEILHCLDFLILNDLEAFHIMEQGKLRRRGQTSSSYSTAPKPFDSNTTLIEDCARYYGEISPQTCVVLTRGPSGAVALAQGKVVAQQPTVKVDPVDPTGAGDSFAAGFLFGLWKWLEERRTDIPSVVWPNEALKQALGWGCAMGTSSVLIKGASIPSSKETIQRFHEEIQSL